MVAGEVQETRADPFLLRRAAPPNMPSRASQAPQSPRTHSGSKSHPQAPSPAYAPVDSYSSSQPSPSLPSSALSPRRRPAQLLPSAESHWLQDSTSASHRGPQSYRHVSQSLPNASLLPSFASSRQLPLPVPSSPTSFGSDPRGFSYSAYSSPGGTKPPHHETPRPYGFATTPSSSPEARARRRSLSLSTGSWGTSSGSGSGGFSEGRRSDSSSISSLKSISSSASGSSSLDRAGSWGSASSGGSIKAWDGGYGGGGAYRSFGGRRPMYDSPDSYPYSSFSALPYGSVDSSVPQLPPSASLPPYRSSHLSSTSTLMPSTASHAASVTSAEDARRAKRTVFSATELDLLQSAWDDEDYYPSMDLVGEMMEQTGLTRTQIRNW